MSHRNAFTRLLFAPCVLVLGVSLFGCADSGTTATLEKVAETPRGSQAEVDAGVVRGTYDFDYDVHSSLAELAEVTNILVSGSVVGWADGRSIFAPSSDGSDVERFAVLEIKVDTPVNILDRSQQQTVYVSVPRGAESVGEDGEPIVDPGQRSTVATVGELERAVPAGTRVIVAGVENASIEEEEYGPEIRVEHERLGVPDAETLVDPFPQGLIFETANGGFASGLVDDDDMLGIAQAAARSAQNKADTPGASGSFENLLSVLEEMQAN